MTVTAIRANRDVLFDGTGPDPSEENLAPLKKAVLENKALRVSPPTATPIASASSTRDGSFISPNHILGLLFDYLLETRGYKLGASRSVATTHLLDAVAQASRRSGLRNAGRLQIRRPAAARRQNCARRRRKRRA